MRYYVTLDNVKYDLESLTSAQRKFVSQMINEYEKGPHWNKFSNYWIREGKRLWKGMKREDVVKHATFKICQDLESRLGIEQGYVRQTDYRDELFRLIEQYKSRYEFCKKMGIDEAFLSHILSKRKNLSITKLEELLDKMGYEITFTKKHLISKR